MSRKFSIRTPLLALIVGIYLELSIRKGICDDSQLTSSNYQQSATKSNNNDNRSLHQHWNGWEDWLPFSGTRENQQTEQQRHSHDIPLSLSEQAKLRSRRNRTEKKYVDKQQQQQQKSQSKSSKNTTEKTGKIHLENEEDSLIDLKSIRDTAKTLATSLLNHFISSWSSSDSHKSATSEPNVSRNSRAIYMDNLGDRPDGPNIGKPEREAKRGVIDWLGRLIGVQGKTLGEFLREYQVHVLYDLAFTFFKWIFFLYAGLLIP